MYYYLQITNYGFWFLINLCASCVHDTVRACILTTGGQLIKFSLEPDLSGVECQTLLQTYMSEHVKKTKITQRLFIK